MQTFHTIESHKPVLKKAYRTTMCFLFGICLAFSFFSHRALAESEYSRASPAYALRFPQDHGAHPSYQTEWWYLTGHLFDEQGSPFATPTDYGFQLTFFRRATAPTQNSADWQQLYLAHAALTQRTPARYRSDRRISRAPFNIAGAHEGRLSVWNRDWRLEMIGDALLIEFAIQSNAKNENSTPLEVKLIARLSPQPVLHGANGYSSKAHCQGCASHYYSMPGLSLQGNIVQNGRSTRVDGLGWYDHEFMTNALTKEQVGWDWYSLSLKDGRHVMLFSLRRNDGSIDFASGTLIEGTRLRTLSDKDFTIRPLEYWTSPDTKARYPVRWSIAVPAAALDTEIQALIPNQEQHDSSITKADAPHALAYWEGAVASPDQQVLGYVEMTGYAGSMAGVL